MKKLLALLVVSFPAFAQIPGLIATDNNIHWTNTNGWMQVQDATNFQTICEGFIHSCETFGGRYNVIDHTNGQRSDNVSVAVLNALPRTEPYRRTNRCPLSSAGNQLVECNIACSHNDHAISVACEATDAANPLRILPVAAGFANHTFAYCKVNPFNDAVSDVIVEITITCQ